MSSQIRKSWAYLSKHETAKGLLLVGIVLVAAIGIWGAVRLGLNTEFPILVVSSPSMCPPANCTLPVGALIVIRGQDPSSIQGGAACGVPAGIAPIGSIIVFRPPGSADPNYLVVHRVRQIIVGSSGQLSFRTQGDANSICDTWGPVPSSRVVGVYQYTIPIPYLGSTILAIREFMYDENTNQPRPQGVAVIVALIVVLFAFEVLEPSKKKAPPAPLVPPPPAVQPQSEKPVTSENP